TPARVQQEVRAAEVSSAPKADGWTAEHVANATGGEWIVPPEPGWTATGVSTYAPAMKDGNLIVMRDAGGSRGFSMSALSQLSSSPSGIIATSATIDELKAIGLPL